MPTFLYAQGIHCNKQKKYSCIAVRAVAAVLHWGPRRPDVQTRARAHTAGHDARGHKMNHLQHKADYRIVNIDDVKPRLFFFSLTGAD